MSASEERDRSNQPAGTTEGVQADPGGQSLPTDSAGRAAAAVIDQAYRSADWLDALPLPRLLADDAAVATEAFAVVLDLDAATRQVTASEVAGDPPPERPPPDAVPPRLAPHAAGAQLRVFADQFARAVAVPGAGGQLDPVVLRDVANRALALRNRPR